MKTANKIVMILTGVVLIVASVLKAHHLLTEPIVSGGFWESRLFFVIQIPLVLGLGIWLVSGLFRKAAWLLGVLALFVFLADTLYKALADAESCGCFGSVEVDPWITLIVFNIPFLLLMLIFRPRDEKLLPPSWPNIDHFLGVAIPTVILLPAVVALLWFNKVEGEVVIIDTNHNVPQINTNPEPIPAPEPKPQPKPAPEPDPNPAPQPEPKPAPEPGEGISETIEPAEPQTKAEPKPLPEVKPEPTPRTEPQPEPEPLPEHPAQQQWDRMAEYIDIGDKLQRGLSITLFYHDTCPDCRELIPQYDRHLRELGDIGINVAFIRAEEEGKPEPEDSPVPPDTPALTGSLTERGDGKKWVIGTPLIFVTIEGKVVNASQFESPTLDELIDSAFNPQG